MDIRQHIPFLSIFIPMMAAIIIPLLKKRKSAKGITFISLGIIMILSLILTVFLINYPKDYFLYNLGHYPAPWGNQLKVGLLESLLSTTFIMVMILSILGGLSSINKDIKEEKQKYYYIMLNLLISSLLALVYTNDIFTSYVFIEINTIAACSIVIAKESGGTIRAAIKYFIMSALGSGLFLLGMAILYSLTGHLLMDNIHESISGLLMSGYMIPLKVSLVLILVSLAVKSALFPFHSWLPDAHSSATSTSSAILSGLVLKGYIILLLKILYRVFGIQIIAQLNILPILLILGILGMLIGSLLALIQKDLKKMIAYSSVAQIGYIYIGIGIGSSLGLLAACFHIIVHALTKSMLFISSGNLMKITNSQSIEDLKGVGYKAPISGLAFIVGGLSMIGIPLFSGFISKVLIANAGISDNTIIMIVVMTGLALSALLNGLYYIPIMLKLFSREKIQEKNINHLNKDKLGDLALILLIIFNIFLGVYSSPIIRLIQSDINNII